MAKYNATPTTTDTFPKIGDGGYDQIMNMSGQRSPYTMPVGRQGPLNDDIGGGNGSARRGSTMLHEGMGPQFRPVATRAYATDAQPRAIRTVPSSVGNRDFWAARADSYAGQTLHG